MEGTRGREEDWGIVLEHEVRMGMDVLVAMEGIKKLLQTIW